MRRYCVEHSWIQLDLNLNTAGIFDISLIPLFPGNFMVNIHCENDLLNYFLKSETIFPDFGFKYHFIFTQTFFFFFVTFTTLWSRWWLILYWWYWDLRKLNLSDRKLGMSFPHPGGYIKIALEKVSCYDYF